MSAETKPVDEVGWQQQWDEAGLFHADIHHGPPEVLLPGNVSLSFGQNAHGARSKLFRWRRRRPVQAVDGFLMCSTPWVSIPSNACRKRRHVRGGHPHDITERNMASITEQIKRMGFSYDWRRTLKSHDPRYYKWNRCFSQNSWKNGLATREFAPVNWCTSCTTVLANEQVKAGRCWRCNGPVAQKRNEPMVPQPSSLRAGTARRT